MPTTLSILVFVASPLDYARYRHTALFFEFSPQAQAQTQTQTQNAENHSQKDQFHDQDPKPATEYIKSSVMEVIGSPGFLSFAERKNWDLPILSTDLARVVPIATLSDNIPISQLRSTVSETPIRDRDGDRDWNSQNWIGEALGRLVTAGYLDARVMDRGLDAMVDAVLEAEDEEILVER